MCYGRLVQVVRAQYNQQEYEFSPLLPFSYLSFLYVFPQLPPTPPPGSDLLQTKKHTRNTRHKRYRFVNGVMSSDADINAGSCKVFSFGKIVDLSPAEVLACFGEHYRSVVADPAGDSHGNIRAFMETGWEGIEFPDGLALASKE